MSLDAPTTKEIYNNVLSGLEASLSQSIPLLPISFLRVLAKVIAAVFTLLYKYGGFMFLQIFVRTATIEETTINGVSVSPLKEWGRLKGVGDPTEATQAELSIRIEVDNQTGTIPSGSQVIGNNNGVTYITIGSTLLNASVVSATVRAVSDQAGGGGAGTIGNLDPGDGLTFANPLANINRAVTVLTQVVTAADEEDTEVYRQRVIDRFQKVPQGGAYADYELWGEESAGIINVYPYTSECPGQVDVYAEATTASSGSAEGIPTTAQLQAVLDIIELDSSGLASRRPAGALVNAFPIARSGFATIVNGLVVDDLAQVQSDITDGVTEYMREREPYIIGLSVPPRLDRVTRSAVGGLVEDIVSAAGGIFSNVVLEILSPFLPSSTYSTQSHDISGEEADPAGFVWSNDGLKFFVVGLDAFVYEYTVSTAYDFSSTVAYSGNSFDVSSEDNDPRAIRFNSDGTKFFILGAQNDSIFEYTLSVAYDFSSTVAYPGNSFDVSSEESAPTSFDFSADGKQFYVVGAGAEIFNYSLTIGYALSSLVAYTGRSFDVSTQDATPVSIVFGDSGRLMYILGGTNDTVYEYALSVAYGFGNDITFTDTSFDVSGEDATPVSLAFDSNLSKFFVTGDANDTVFEYTFGTADVAVDLYTLGEGEKAKSTGVTFAS